MHSSFRRSVILTVAVIGLSGLTAVAAPPASNETPAAQPTSPAQPSGRHDAAPTVNQRIADLHAKLMISPAQEAKWAAVTQLMHDNAQGMDQTAEHRMKLMPGMTAPENLQSYAQVATRHAETMQKMVPAFQELYDTMSDTQKKTADQVFRADGHHHGEHARHG